jgi:hypothetical protein
MTTPLFSVNAAAEILERDRRTITKALRPTPPDGNENGQPRWRLKTILDALEMMTNDQDRHGPLIDQIEADFESFDVGFAKLQAEPDLERRRQLDKSLGVGALIGGLDRQMNMANAAIGEERGAIAIASDTLIGDLISRYVTLLDYWPTDLAR